MYRELEVPVAGSVREQGRVAAEWVREVLGLCDEFARHLLIPEDGVRAWLDRAAGTVGQASC